MSLPPLFWVRQRFATDRLRDVRGAVSQELAASGITVHRGARIAIAVGSRGIANLPELIAAVADWVRAQGAVPFIVPAMGSHAGATAEGQQRLLEKLGVDCAPIVSSMDTVAFGPLAFMDRAAATADGTIVVNRIKPHTSFHGRYESGLLKMIAVGLGKQTGAEAIHQHGTLGLRELMPAAAQEILRRGNILLGLAIVENAYDETLRVRALPAERIVAEEPGLLDLARQHLPALPVDALDVLVVDELGKEISGTGMDTNVIGRLRIPGEPEPAGPRIGRIFVRDLRGESAYGIGLADVTTRRLVDRADWRVTETNVRTSGFLERGKVPRVAETDEEALEWALQAGPRVIRIQNTLRLETLLASAPVCEEMAGGNGIEVLGPGPDWFAPFPPR